MGFVKEEVKEAIKILELGEDDIRLLNSKDRSQVFDKCFSHFVKPNNKPWWWEDFRQDNFIISGFEEPYKHLINIIPNIQEKVWLITEDDGKVRFQIYECRPEILTKLIGECYGFEYYIINKEMKWLICENHHGILIGIGENLKKHIVGF